MQGLVTNDNHIGMHGTYGVQITLKPIISQSNNGISVNTSRTIYSYNTPINYAMLTGFIAPSNDTNYVYSYFIDHIAKTAHKLMLHCNAFGNVTKNLTYETYNSLITTDEADKITFNLNSVKYSDAIQNVICVPSITTIVPNAVQYEFIKQPNIHYLDGVAFEPRCFGYHVGSVYNEVFGNSTGIWRYLEKAVTNNEVTIDATSRLVKYISIIYIERRSTSLSDWVPVHIHKTYDLTTNKVYKESVDKTSIFPVYTSVSQFDSSNIDIQTNSIILKGMEPMNNMVYGFIVMSSPS